MPKKPFLLLALLVIALFFAQAPVKAQYGIYGDSRDFPAAGLEVGPNQAVPTTPTSSGTYSNQEKIPGAGTTSDFVEYIKQIIRFGFAAIGILALFMLSVGAYQYLMAAGNLAKTDSAKETIGSALLGLVLGLIAFITLRTINPQLVSLQLTSPGGPGGTASSSALQSLATGNVPASEQARMAKYDSLVQEISKKSGIDPNITRAIIKQESNWNPEAIGKTGDYGIMQINQKSHPGFFQSNTWSDPQANISYGTGYFSGLLNNQAKGDLYTALAMYNGGPGNPNYTYADKVMLNYYNYQKAGYN